MESITPEAAKILANRSDWHCENGVCYPVKLMGGTVAAYGTDTAFYEHIDFDESQMSLVIPYADGRNRDGVGDLLEVSGINTERHRKNPCVLLDHGKQTALPIGMAAEWDAEKGWYDFSKYTNNIDIANQSASLKAYFYRGKGMTGTDRKNEYDHAVLCEQLFDMAVKRLLVGGSIGYQVIRAKQLHPDYDQGKPAGLHLLEVLMLEGSLVVMPANADTVRKALAMPTICGKPMSPYLIKTLEPYAPAKKAQMGYEGKATETWKKGDKFDIFGEEWEIVKVVNKGRQFGQEFDCVHYDNDQFGKPVPKYQSFHFRDLNIARRKSLDEIPGDLNWLKEEQAEAEHKSVCHCGGKCAACKEHKHGHKEEKKIPPARWKPGVGAIKELRKKYKAQPSDKIRPEDARAILKEGEVDGHKLSSKQRGMFGAAAGRSKAYHQRAMHPLKFRLSTDTIKIGDTVTARAGLLVINPDGSSGGMLAHSGERLLVVGERDGKFVVVNKKTNKQGTAHASDVRKNPSKMSKERPPHDDGPDPLSRVEKEEKPKKTPTAAKEEEHSSGKKESYFAICKRDDEGHCKPKSMSKSLDLRRKHRTTAKGLRRRLRKSIPGASIMVVRGKDIKAVEQAAIQKGLKFARMGPTKGGEKVKVMGDDTAADELAKDFGLPLRATKSLNTKDMNMAREMRREVKSAPDAMPDEDADTVAEDQAMPENEEKYSSQVLRRMHKDASYLLKDYDGLMGPLEHEPTKKHLQGKLEGLVKELDALEGLHGEHHPEEEPLTGMKDMDEDDASPEEEAFDDGEEEGADEEAEAEEGDFDAVEADSGEKDLPDEDEVVEGMEQDTKALRKFYGKGGNGAQRTYGKGSLNGKRKSADPEDIPGYEEHQKKPGKEGSEADLKRMKQRGKSAADPEATPGYEESQEKPGHPGMEADFKALEDHEKERVKEAHHFLKDVSETNDWDDEYRMKSYHFHKSLEPIGEDPEDVPGYEEFQNKPGGPDTTHTVTDNDMSGKHLNGKRKAADASTKPGYEEFQHKPGEQDDDGTLSDDIASKGMGCTNHRHTIHAAAKFLKGLSMCKDFGDPHRAEALLHHKAMDPIAREDEAVEMQEGGMPGEMGEKAAELTAISEANAKALEGIAKKLKMIRI